MVNGSGTVKAPGGDIPGKELPKDLRALATELVVRQGWRYDDGRRRGGHPMLFPADSSKGPVTLSTTPGDHRAFRNTVSRVRHAGGIWPPPKER